MNGYLPITARCDQRLGVWRGHLVKEVRDPACVELARARRTRRLDNWLLILVPDVVALEVLLLGLGHRARRRRDLAPSTVPTRGRLQLRLKVRVVGVVVPHEGRGDPLSAQSPSARHFVLCLQ
jgi:hypothetical protein